MKFYKVCFIGIGSIAKRHIKNLKEIARERGYNLCIDAFRRFGTVGEGGEDFANIYMSYEEVPDDYDAIFITNPTEFHLDSLLAVGNKSKTFFIEKPLTSIGRLHQLKELALHDEAVCYVACPLRYTKVIQFIKEFVKKNKVIGVRCISSSYLPEWRPGMDYRKTYSANKEMGGGVSIDLIHEWDYIKFVFGMPNEIVYRKGKKSNLEIDCEDTALYIAEYENMFVELHLDYFGRKSIREIMIFTEEDTVVGDLINSQIIFQSTGKVIEFEQDRDSFQKAELVHFLEIMEKRKSDNTIWDAYRTIQLTQGIVEA